MAPEPSGSPEPLVSCHLCHCRPTLPGLPRYEDIDAHSRKLCEEASREAVRFGLCRFVQHAVRAVPVRCRFGDPAVRFGSFFLFYDLYVRDLLRFLDLAVL